MYWVWLMLIRRYLIHQLQEPLHIILHRSCLTDMKHPPNIDLVLVTVETSVYSRHKLFPRCIHCLHIRLEPYCCCSSEQRGSIGCPEVFLRHPPQKILLASALPQFRVRTLELRQFNLRPEEAGARHWSSPGVADHRGAQICRRLHPPATRCAVPVFLPPQRLDLSGWRSPWSQRG